MANNTDAVKNLRPFKKGDPRINRKGRPKSFDKLRQLAQQVAGEAAAYDPEAHKTLTRIELMLRAMSTSKHPSDRKTFLEYCYGKVKDEIELTDNTNYSPEQIAQKVAGLLALAQERKDANNA